MRSSTTESLLSIRSPITLPLSRNRAISSKVETNTEETAVVEEEEDEVITEDMMTGTLVVEVEVEVDMGDSQEDIHLKLNQSVETSTTRVTGEAPDTIDTVPEEIDTTTGTVVVVAGTHQEMSTEVRDQEETSTDVKDQEKEMSIMKDPEKEKNTATDQGVEMITVKDQEEETITVKGRLKVPGTETGEETIGHVTGPATSRDRTTSQMTVTDPDRLSGPTKWTGILKGRNN